VALEGALKLKEISYIHAEGYPAAEMKHGPIALVDDQLPVVFVATKDAYHEKVVSNMQEIKARKGRVISVITAEMIILLRFQNRSCLYQQLMKLLRRC
jgi:glucosamine--fructose-6-phosphate aminotransferase (isomerizing)